MSRIILGVSGASGTILAKRTLDRLVQEGHQVDLVISRAAQRTAALEDVELPEPTYKINDFSALIASGSHLVDGMVIVPCAMTTLAAIASGLSDNLLRRAADVTLKERRRLVIVPRETPLSMIHLENMSKIARAGGIILPPVPAWYLKPQTLEEMEEAIVAKIFDLLALEAPFANRWDDVHLTK